MKKIILTFLILLFSLPSFSGKYDSLEIVTHKYGDGSKSYFVNGLPITTKTYSSYIRGEIGAKKLIDIAHNDKESKERQITNTKNPEEEVITDADKAKTKTIELQRKAKVKERKAAEKKRKAAEKKRMAAEKKRKAAEPKAKAAEPKAKDKKKRDDKTKELQRETAVYAGDAFSVLYGYESDDGNDYQVLLEYRGQTVTTKWKGGNGESYLDSQIECVPSKIQKFQYEGLKFQHIAYTVRIPKCGYYNGTSTKKYYGDYYYHTYDFKNNILTMDFLDDGSQVQYKILNHSFGNPAKKITLGISEEDTSVPTINLFDTYLDYLIIKNLYFEGDSFYVLDSQMNQAKKISVAIQSHYENSITSLDRVWQRAVTEYKNKWSDRVGNLNANYNSNGSDIIEGRMYRIVNRANKIGISDSNTVKDF